MVDYREVLRLHSLGHNISQIAGSLHSSRNTVREVERLADEKEIRWPLGEEVIFTMQLPVSAKEPIRYRIQSEKPALLILHPTNRMFQIAIEPEFSPTELIPDHGSSSMYPDNSYAIEIEADGLLIRMSNGIKPVLLKILMDMLKKSLCQQISQVLMRSIPSVAEQICVSPLINYVRSSRNSCLWRSTMHSFFCGRKCDRIKAILKEPGGIVMIYKRLTAQGSYRWPRNKSEVRNLTWREFDWLMSGINIEQLKAIKTT